jgi:hypothetical protein
MPGWCKVVVQWTTAVHVYTEGMVLFSLAQTYFMSLLPQLLFENRASS